jgi:hypothetical protein
MMLVGLCPVVGFPHLPMPAPRPEVPVPAIVPELATVPAVAPI